MTKSMVYKIEKNSLGNKESVGTPIPDATWHTFPDDI